MRYSQIRSIDVSNGENIGISLFVQGCPEPHCHNCFNPETWDFNGGKEWTQEVEDKFIELANKPYIKRISLLGGECLAEQNLDGVLNLANKIRLSLPNKSIWLYSGFTWEQIVNDGVYLTKDCAGWKRREIVKSCDVFIDGRYIDSQRDITLKYRGSSNQRVIDVQKSLEQDKIVLYCD